MPSKVFISYRREDSRSEARLIHRALAATLPRDHVFIDIDGSIPLGADYVRYLENWIEQSDIVLAIIGKGWIDAVAPDTGKRRLENPRDPVRIELRKGLKLGAKVVPVFWDDAPALNRDRLPSDLKKLAHLQAEFIVHRSFDADVERLIKGLRLEQDDVEKPPMEPPAKSAPTPAFEQRMRAEGRILIDAAFVENTSGKWFKPGNGETEWFKDHEQGPEMVVVPAGKFTRGSPDNEPKRSERESPRREVTIASPFAVGRHAVTRAQFAAFVSDTDRKIESGAFVWNGKEWKNDPKASWRNPGFAQDDNHPVVCINWDDASAYASWLTEATGKPYRLPTEAEREYVTRAGTTTPFWWGSSITPLQANYDGNYVYEGGGKKGEWRKATVSAGTFDANPWGLYNVHGNVWEWCEDVWHDTYEGAPADGSAWLQDEDQSRRVVRGGSWYFSPGLLRSAFRLRYSAVFRYSNLGFRVVRTLTS